MTRKNGPSIRKISEKELMAMIKILLAEDSKFLRIATERALARAGYEVYSAGDGEEALRMAREKVPDLILLHMLLPRMSGPEVLAALQKDGLTKEIPVAVITGMSQKNEERLRKEGASGFLGKTRVEMVKGSEKRLMAMREILHRVTTEPTEATTA